MMPDRKYAMTKIGKGDYLLPSNDGKTIWRIRRYTDGPSGGLDWDADRDLWGIWRWLGSSLTAFNGACVDDWSQWDFMEGFHDTRKEAVDAALKLA